MGNIPTMLTIKEAAQKSELPEHYIRQLIKQKKIIYVKAGKKFLVNLERFIEYLNLGDNVNASHEQEKGKIRRIV